MADQQVHDIIPNNNVPLAIDEPFELTEEERKICKEQCKMFGRSVVSITLLHPLAFARVLMQIGHEPYPLTTGKTFIFFGRKAHFLPNAFKYVNNVYQSHGFLAIYAGLGANIMITMTKSIGQLAARLYLKKCCPNVGGNQSDIRENALLMMKDGEYEPQLDFRIILRETIRSSIVVVAGIVVSRPFCVIMVRQIAQHIGQETKYAAINPFQPLLLIGAEEGPSGFFSGLVPNIVAGLLSVWGTVALNYGANLAFKQIEKQGDQHDPEFCLRLAMNRRAIGRLISFGMDYARYPFDVVATLMALTGSGLMASMMPYSPVFTNWTDAYNSLKPYGLYRGAKTFMREAKGPIRVGPDQRLYAGNQREIMRGLD